MRHLTHFTLFAIVLILSSCQKDNHLINSKSNLFDDPELKILYNSTDQTLVSATEYLGLTADAKDILAPDYLKAKLEEYTNAEEKFVDQIMENNTGSDVFVIYVPDDYPTIQEAIDAAEPTNAVIVNGGIYDEDLVISANNVRLLGAEEPVINGSITMATDGFNMLVKGFIINYTGITGSAITNPEESMGNRFVRNFINTIGDGSESGEQMFVTAVDVRGDACIVRKNIITTAANGISVEGGEVGHVVAGNEIQLYEMPLAGSSIAIQLDGDNNAVKNNYINNFADGIFGGFDSDDNLIKKNTIENGLVGVNIFGSNIEVNENRCFNNLVCDIINNGDSSNTEFDNTADCIQGF